MQAELAEEQSQFAATGNETGLADLDSPLVRMFRKSRSEAFGPEVKRRIMLGTYALSEGYYDAYYLKALKVRRLIRQDYDQAFENVDLLLGPVTPTPAYGIGEKVDTADPAQGQQIRQIQVGGIAGVERAFGETAVFPFDLIVEGPGPHLKSASRPVGRVAAGIALVAAQRHAARPRPP